MADLDAARNDADAAAKREGAAKRELEGAEEDLRAAQKRGERAERAAEDAAQAAGGALRGSLRRPPPPSTPARSPKPARPHGGKAMMRTARSMMPGTGPAVPPRMSATPSLGSRTS
jgi:hypothetical protein